MAWIRTVDPADAEGPLRRLYDRVAGPGGHVDNILRLHALRPHSLEGHMTLYKNVLHHRGNELPTWLLEAIGVYVSLLNECDYCVVHHGAGLGRLVGDEKGRGMLEALRSGEFGTAFTPEEVLLLEYAERLTRAPWELDETWLDRLRAAGFDDGRILEANQVASYFAYANRTVMGLGGTAEGERLGLSPGTSDDPDDWSHG